MRPGSTVLAALLAVCFFRLLTESGPDRVAIWRVLPSALAGAAVAAGVARVTDAIRTSRRAKRGLR